jgi:alkylation response protein AidB-like acyl-CoA dehydrogenase
VTPEQLALRDVLRSFFVADPAPTWQRLLSELGLDTVVFDAGAPGSDATPVDLAILAEEAGAALFDGPLVPSVLAGVLGADHPDLVARLRDGTATVASTVIPVDVTVRDGRVDATAEPVWGSVDSAQAVILGASAAAWLSLADVDVTPLAGIDLTREFSRVTARGVTPLAVWEPIPAQAQRLTSLVISAELLGIAQHAFDATVEYVRTRVQFGRTIGSFQAIKHRLADLYAALELARSAVYGAAIDLNDLDLAVAAALTRDTALSVTKAAVQLHGGIAITWEHWAHRYLRRAHAVVVLTGSAAEHHRRLADLIDQRDGLNV